MPEPVMKRHPRRAVWLWWLSEYGLLMLALVAAVFSALTGSREMVAPWLLVGGIVLVYQRRLESAWSWGWRSGHDETLRVMMPHVRLDRDNVDELYDALMVQGPTWRQRQEELAKIDYKATMRASMEQLEKVWAQTEEPGSK